MTDSPPIHVLVIDDDEVDRRWIRRLLGEACRMSESDGGSSTPEQFDGHRPDCVVLDYNIPGTDTLELLSQFVRQDIPVVMLTAQKQAQAAAKSFKAGAGDYLQKDLVDGQTLHQSIRQAMETAARRREAEAGRQRLREAYRNEREKRRELETSLRIARDIQQNLTPTDPPDLDHFDVGGLLVPAESSSGDFFDYVYVSGAKMGLLIGDVSGHGIGPALLATETRAYIRAFARNDSEPGRILSAANRMLAEDIKDGRFVTCYLAIVDDDQRTIRFASAGHPSFHVNSQGEMTTLDTGGVVLGVMPDSFVPTSADTKFESGDILLLMTDGVYESRPRKSDDFFGIARCVDVVNANRDEPAQKIADRLFEASRSHCQGCEQEDDITIVVMKCL